MSIPSSIRSFLVSWPGLAAFLFFVGCACGAQQCLPPALTPSHDLNLFNEQQEYQLGEVFAEQISYSLHVIEDESVAGYLQKVGDRLVAQMPSTKIRFRFFLVDSPEANAFAIPGGRVYLTRKLITTVRSEDELAGVIGHEMGHQLAHHGALDWSRVFHNVLGAQSVGDQADIEDKYNQVLDIYRTKGSISAGDNVERHQSGADQVAVYAVARAGYSPQAVVGFWDRFSESHGKKGSWLSDFFGETPPESKRLREFVKDLGSLPAGCIVANRGASTQDFTRWQTTVRNYNGFGKKESLRNVVLKRSLEPSLHGDIQTFRFSPDGRFLLAQDDGGVFVLGREPLANLFHIDAPNASAAQFSPDSRYVVFYSEALRVERWNVAEQQLEDIHEVYVYRGCAQSELSSDGNFLACIRWNYDGSYTADLVLYDLATGDSVLTKKEFVAPREYGRPTFFDALMFFRGNSMLVAMSFSPDARYLLASHGEKHLMVDLKSMAEVDVPGALRKATSYSFAFVGPDKVVGAENEDCQRAMMVKMPSGETVTLGIPLGGRSLYSVTKGLYAVVRPMSKAPLGVVDLEAKQIFRASHTDATDIFGNVLVSERVNGEVALYQVRGEKPFATANLPHATLGRLAAVAIGPQASAIAISQAARGAVWDLTNGEQLAHVLGFRGAFFDEDGLYLDFAPRSRFPEIPSVGETVKDVRQREAQAPGDVLARADLKSHAIAQITATQKRIQVRQFGSVVLNWSPADDDHPDKDITLEARDAHNGKVMWSRVYSKDYPHIDGSGATEIAVFSWDLRAKGAKEELKDDPEAKRLRDAVKETEGSYLVEVVDLRSGSSLGKFPVATGRASFRARRLLASGGALAMIDTNNRVSLYSYKGEKTGRLFGGEVALSDDGSWLCVEREPGRLALYSLQPLRRIDEMTFPNRLVYFGFAADNQHLVAVTADQTTYVLSLER